jgi:hypothetical protein
MEVQRVARMKNQVVLVQVRGKVLHSWSCDKERITIGVDYHRDIFGRPRVPQGKAEFFGVKGHTGGHMRDDLSKRGKISP